MLDVMSGEVDVTMQPISESMTYVRDGRLTALGQTGVKRSSIAKDIPTIEEAGIQGYSSTTWYMLLGPANLPAPIVTYIQTQLSRALKTPDLQAKLEASGLNVINADPAQTKAFLNAEYEKWKKIIQVSGTVIE